MSGALRWLIVCLLILAAIVAAIALAEAAGIKS